MRNYIERVRAEPKRFITQRPGWTRLLGYPTNILSKSFPTLYIDKYLNFRNYFLMALDFDILMHDCLVISFVDRWWINIERVQSRLLLGVLLAYLWDKFLIW